MAAVPPNLTVPQEKSPLVTREGDTIELQCQVTGKPKPIILWTRADKEVAMPDGSMQMESYDGTLRIVNVSREMSGMYRCQTSQYNGFNVTPREALVQLIVQYPPAVEPAFLEIRQGQDRSVTMSCRVLRAYPIRVLTYEWRLGNKLLRMGQFDSQEYTEYTLKDLSNENYGIYNCNIINEAGAGRCSYLVTGTAEEPSKCAALGEHWVSEMWELEQAHGGSTSYSRDRAPGLSAEDWSLSKLQETPEQSLQL
ncbi:MAM domain-containing glycosylphosphatidylinositol anchor protein 2-like [Trichosurus vulpecula]|uniref:MAM domain-containing glycosylphosphatidylinositol anchor protein 2-like n=1 Tax=Trichosurus vulpecula TaxID=9337 RepID=UPI00186AEBBB|nr:MAM domain-containing glycosylphosphatidylinositol anchor protein 2-like [Trichosurus vulpecula]